MKKNLLSAVIVLCACTAFAGWGTPMQMRERPKEPAAVAEQLQEQRAQPAQAQPTESIQAAAEPAELPRAAEKGTQDAPQVTEPKKEELSAAAPGQPEKLRVPVQTTPGEAAPTAAPMPPALPVVEQPASAALPTQAVEVPTPAAPVETVPPVTEAPAVVPQERELPVAQAVPEAPTTEPPTQADAVPPATETAEPEHQIPPEPTACPHSWQTEYHEEVGHSVSCNACACGYRFEGIGAYDAHLEAYAGTAEQITVHGHWGTVYEWVVDSPAWTESVCTLCGAVK